MKRVIFKSTLIFVIMLCAHCIANCGGDETYVPCPKTYVSSDQVTLSEKTILVNLNDMLIQTEYLRTDAQGIFFETAREKDCSFLQWRCERKMRGPLYCNACNWVWEDICGTCGARRN